VKGNPHIAWAESAFGAASAEADPTFNRNVRQDAQIQAILALTYEQRTANLIAMMQLTAGEWSKTGARQIAREIAERLGLK
jgi:hypothetical protein